MLLVFTVLGLIMTNKVKLKNITTYSFSNREELLEYIKNKNKILIAINAEKILNKNKKLHEIINDNIGYPDGTGAVLVLKQKGFDAVRIPGVELWLDIIEKFEKEKTFYLIGSSKKVIDTTVSMLKKDFIDIKILGYRDGYLNEKDIEVLKKDLILKKPDVIFVAQGSPRQEYLMNDLTKVHSALYMGLGGSYDIYCGLKKRAPALFINLGLEWLYRLITEPTRISRQIVLLKFVLLVAMKRI